MSTAGATMRRGVARFIVILRRLSISKTIVGRRFLNGLIHRRREIRDGAVVLVGGKAACDVDPVKQPPAGSNLGERCCCRVSVCVDPEGGPGVQEEMIEHERLQNRDAATALHIEEG